MNLRVSRECDLTPSYIKIGVHGLIPDDITKTFYQCLYTCVYDDGCHVTISV